MPDVPDSPLLDQFLDAVWLEAGLSPNTLAAYRADLRAFQAWLIKRKLTLEKALPQGAISWLNDPIRE